MFWIKFLHGLLKTLNADTSPEEISTGIVLGTTIGLIPKGNLTALALAIIVWTFRVNVGMAGAAILLASFVSLFTDPFTERLGYWLLSDVKPLQGLWPALYNTPIVPFTAFNQTLLMGNLAFSLLIAIPLFFVARRGVLYYRANYRDRVAHSKVLKLFTVTHYLDLVERWKDR